MYEPGFAGETAVKQNLTKGIQEPSHAKKTKDYVTPRPSVENMWVSQAFSTLL